MFGFLFYGYGFGEISGLIDIPAFVYGNVVGQQLQWDRCDQRSQPFVGFGKLDDRVGESVHLMIAPGHQCYDYATFSADSKLVEACVFIT